MGVLILGHSECMSRCSHRRFPHRAPFLRWVGRLGNLGQIKSIPTFPGTTKLLMGEVYGGIRRTKAPRITYKLPPQSSPWDRSARNSELSTCVLLLQCEFRILVSNLSSIECAIQIIIKELAMLFAFW